ncbi:hypothetical protein ACFXGE_04265, partial [Streptomyces sp. NPDC059378]
MTDTTQTQPTPSGGADETFSASKPRSPEFRLAADALRGMRQDLFHDAFAYRPLPRLGSERPLLRRLSGRARAYAAWTPHATVALGGVLALTAATSSFGGSTLTGLLCGLLAVIPVALTLIRPVGAFWLSLASTLVVGVLSWPWGDRPWAQCSAISHVVVLTVVGGGGGPAPPPPRAGGAPPHPRDRARPIESRPHPRPPP